MEKSILIWGLITIIAIPLLALILIECSRFLEKQGSLFSPVAKNAWKYIFPLTVILLVTKKLLNLSDTNLVVKFIETGFWLAAIVTLLSMLGAILTTKEVAPGRWQIHVPNLFFQLTRGLVLSAVLYYIFQVIWQVNLSNLASALGVGSLVIALALQDTFSSLVSGFLLAIDQPFKVGDWIIIPGVEGEVIDQNWRAVRVETLFGDEIIIPNSVLSEAIITNPVHLHPWIWRVVFVRFAYYHLPNQVKKIILEEVIQKTEGIFPDPEPVVRVHAYEDFYIKYYVGYAISDQEYRLCLHYDDIIMTKIYYATRRNNLVTPISTKLEYKNDKSPFNPYYNPYYKYNNEYIKEFLQVLSYFSYLDQTAIENLAQEAILKSYGVKEYIIQAGEPDEGLYLILEGSVKLYIKDWQNEEKVVSHLFKGDLFGEMALLEGELSPVSVLALEDVEALIINHQLINSIIDKNPKFAKEMNQFIEERKRSIGFAQGKEKISEEETSENSFTQLPFSLKKNKKS